MRPFEEVLDAVARVLASGTTATNGKSTLIKGELTRALAADAGVHPADVARALNARHEQLCRKRPALKLATFKSDRSGSVAGS